MISSWTQFNESYDQEVMTFDQFEKDVFEKYYYDQIGSVYLGDNVYKSKNPLLNILHKFLDIVNEELDSSIGISEENLYFRLGGIRDTDSTPWSIGVGLRVRASHEILWNKLKYWNFKPGFETSIKLPEDDIEDLTQKRYLEYYKGILNRLNKIDNLSIDIAFSELKENLVIYFRFDNFKFVDPFDKKNVIPFLEKHPECINGLYKHGDADELFDFILDNPKAEEALEGQNNLDFIKRHKSITDPDRSQMEEENQMYIFIARPKFVDKKDGSYKKDIDIENLVAIDPYDFKDAYNLTMMKLRARMQSNDSDVYCIWLPKDMYEDDDLQNINDPEMGYLRSLIDQKKEKI